MSNKYQELSNLKYGTYDYKIKVRLIRLWRGMTNTGEDFKGFNIMLLDSKVRKNLFIEISAHLIN